MSLKGMDRISQILAVTALVTGFASIVLGITALVLNGITC
jgi:hypothetical protein